MPTKDKTTALAEAEALAYMICETFFAGADTGGQVNQGGRLEAAVYLLADLLSIAVGGGRDVL